MTSDARYTCTDYRQEMILLGMKRRLSESVDMPEADRKQLLEEIKQLEAAMAMD